jgi:hypothetical protein
MKAQGEEDYWNMPLDAVLMSGGGNYGSEIIDSLISNTMLQIIVCDTCLRQRMNRTREVDLLTGKPIKKSET